MPAEEIYGPQFKEIDTMFDRVASLTVAEGNAMALARTANTDDLFGPTGAWTTVFEAAEHAGLEDQLEQAVNDVITATDEKQLDEVKDLDGTIAEAVAGVAARHLVGQYGFTQEHYDLLTGPWSRVIGMP